MRVGPRPARSRPGQAGRWLAAGISCGRCSALPLEIFVRRGFPHALKPLDARRRFVFLLVQLGTGDAKLFRRVDGHGKDLARLEEFDDDIRPYGNVIAGTNRQ